MERVNLTQLNAVDLVRKGNLERKSSLPSHRHQEACHAEMWSLLVLPEILAISYHGFLCHAMASINCEQGGD